MSILDGILEIIKMDQTNQLNQNVSQLKNEVSNSNRFLEDIANISKNSSKQTDAMYVLSGVMVIFAIVQICIALIPYLGMNAIYLCVGLSVISIFVIFIIRNGISFIKL